MKYHNTKVTIGSHVFSSKLEASLYQRLCLREKAGEISALKLQPKIYLTRARLLYTLDFFFVDRTIHTCVWAEAKGHSTRDWAIKKRLWAAGYGPGRLEIYTGTYLKLKGPEVIIPDPLRDIVARLTD